MKEFALKSLRYIWSRRTTTFGYAQVCVSVLAASSGVFEPETLKYILLTNALLTALLGHYNHRKNVTLQP